MPRGSRKGLKYSQCPFYKYDDSQAKRIVCEGVIDESWLALNYHRKKDYDTQLSVFCCEYYKKCEIYRMLMENKYDEED